MHCFHKIKQGDKSPVEVYKNSKGEYKLAPEGNPVDFLLYCAAIPVGMFLVFIMICDISKEKRKNTDENKMIDNQ
ncbi:putative uncharacterized protein [Ruminococcus sp. CAG:563]|nr:putative uncharacterized protein [Ruminococcus sp. CAG:563]